MRSMMFVTLLILSLMTAPALAASSSPKPARAPVCGVDRPQVAGSGPVRVVREPAADGPYDLHVAIVRKVDGCLMPTILRTDVEGGARRPNAKPPRLYRPL